jgi:hypothetical protein
MSGFEHTVFGPLRKPYCNYFYFLSVFGYIFMIGSLISLLYIGAKTKKTEPKFYMAGFAVIFTYGIIYFQNRLLYSMCIGSLREGMKAAPKPTCNKDQSRNIRSSYDKDMNTSGYDMSLIDGGGDKMKTLAQDQKYSKFINKSGMLTVAGTDPSCIGNLRNFVAGLKTNNTPHVITERPVSKKKK